MLRLGGGPASLRELRNGQDLSAFQSRSIKIIDGKCKFINVIIFILHGALFPIIPGLCFRRFAQPCVGAADMGLGSRSNAARAACDRPGRLVPAALWDHRCFSGSPRGEGRLNAGCCRRRRFSFSFAELFLQRTGQALDLPVLHIP